MDAKRFFPSPLAALMGWVLCGAALLVISAVAWADSYQVSASVDYYGDSLYYYVEDQPSGQGVYFNEVIFSDLDQFDPSLGALTDVIVDAEFEYYYEIVLFSGEKIDPFAEFEANVYSDELNFFIGYSPGSSGNTHVLNDFVYPELDVYIYGLSEDEYLQDSYDESGFNYVTAQSLTQYSSYDVSDFVGTGQVQSLSMVVTEPVGVDFYLVNLYDADAEIYYDMYQADITLTYIFDPHLPGDANGDNAVNLDDFIILKQHYGQTDASWADGDFNGDGVVDLDDFIILKQNYGASVVVVAASD